MITWPTCLKRTVTYHLSSYPSGPSPWRAARQKHANPLIRCLNNPLKPSHVCLDTRCWTSPPGKAFNHSRCHSCRSCSESDLWTLSYPLGLYAREEKPICTRQSSKPGTYRACYLESCQQQRKTLHV